ncbi:MAG: M15 family metallopeptidase [Bacilli bacterium]|nr:M15 family metallopeptidase [Bacilli bacterium]MDD4809472.1 M15 family metallopeptidase [Bacilli bacterium]
MWNKLFRRKKRHSLIKYISSIMPDFFRKKERERNQRRLIIGIIIVLFILGGTSFLILSDFKKEEPIEPEQPVIEEPNEEIPDENPNDIKYYEPIDGQIKPVNNNLEFELPINGATGYTTIQMSLKKSNSADSETIEIIIKGESFRIISEEGNWWYINYNGSKGWVNNTYCMINLPDVIPSIVYDNTNSYKSLFISSGHELSGVTNEKLYNVLMYNKRLDKDQFIMPVLYSMAKKINKAQQLALRNGDSLKIYETFRPYEVQMKVANSFSILVASNKDIYNDINSSGWGQVWFIVGGLSTHQIGTAMDTSLVKVDRYTIKNTGKYKYIEIVDYTEYTMPTRIHDLTSKSAVFKYGVMSDSKTAWKGVPLSPTITVDAIKLQNYCTGAGLTPLASEWWHFNDLDAQKEIMGHESDGRYYLTELVSVKVAE